MATGSPADDALFVAAVADHSPARNRTANQEGRGEQGGSAFHQQKRDFVNQGSFTKGAVNTVLLQRGKARGGI